MTIRVALADDHPLVRAGLAMLIGDMQGYEVVAQAGDGLEALAIASEFKPDVLLMDIDMPRMSGMTCLEKLVEREPDIKVLMLSMHANADHVARAIELGALGYLLKGADPAELELAIRTVSSGAVWYSAAIAPLVVGKHASRPPAQPAHAVLTPRQIEILKRLAEGATAKQLAYELSLSIKTVENHRNQIMERLGVHDLPGLVRYAIRSGIISA